jgi:hypothetical protein
MPLRSNAHTPSLAPRTTLPAMAMDPIVVVLPAKEAVAASGENRYQTPCKTFEQLWKAIDPAGFRRAVPPRAAAAAPCKPRTPLAPSIHRTRELLHFAYDRAHVETPVVGPPIEGKLHVGSAERRTGARQAVELHVQARCDGRLPDGTLALLKVRASARDGSHKLPEYDRLHAAVCATVLGEHSVAVVEAWVLPNTSQLLTRVVRVSFDPKKVTDLLGRILQGPAEWAAPSNERRHLAYGRCTPDERRSVVRAAIDSV